MGGINVSIHRKISAHLARVQLGSRRPHSCHSLSFFPPRSDPDLQINQAPNIPSSHHYRSFFDPPNLPLFLSVSKHSTENHSRSDGVPGHMPSPPRNKKKRRSRSRWFEKPQIQTSVFPSFSCITKSKIRRPNRVKSLFLCDRVGVPAHVSNSRFPHGIRD